MSKRTGQAVTLCMCPHPLAPFSFRRVSCTAASFRWECFALSAVWDLRHCRICYSTDSGARMHEVVSQKTCGIARKRMTAAADSTSRKCRLTWRWRFGQPQERTPVCIEIGQHLSVPKLIQFSPRALRWTNVGAAPCFATLRMLLPMPRLRLQLSPAAIAAVISAD